VTAYRTTATTVAGLLAILALAVITGELSLPAELSANLAYAIVGVCLGQAGRSSVEAWRSPGGAPASV